MGLKIPALHPLTIGWVFSALAKAILGTVSKDNLDDGCEVQVWSIIGNEVDGVTDGMMWKGGAALCVTRIEDQLV